jgi:riboflavin kinase/FMN adenylyltransferase
MELIRGLHNLRAHHHGCVATIGAFDGVHKGHQAVLAKMLAKAKELGVPSTVIVFEPLPREYFAPVQSPARLMNFREKFVALSNLGVDRVLRIRFDESFSHMSADDFIRTVFVDGLGIRAIIAGDDLRFGRDRGGDTGVLSDAGTRYGFEVLNTDTMAERDERVSSTRVRNALAASDFALAEKLLGRPYGISGKVVVGQQLGRKLGSPTANIQLRRLRAPLSGVYAVDVIGLGKPLHAVANIGTRPTVDDSIKAILEVHILDFNADIYGKTINVVFRQKIRDEKKFASLDELKANIHADIDTAKRYFGMKI